MTGRWRPVLALALSLLGSQVAQTREVPAGGAERMRLDRAILLLADRNGIDISLASPDIGGLLVPRPHGKAAVGEALKIMLRGKPVVVKRIGRTSWVLAAAPPPRRPAPRPLAVPHPSSTQTAEPAAIVVLGLKRASPLADVAAQVDVVAAGDIGFQNDGAGEALRRQVGSIASTRFGAGREKIFIRGIADSSFSGPLQSLVGTYFGDIRLVYTSPDPALRLIDLQSVEIWEGPQSTLYGTGALGGIIRINPAPVDLARATGEMSGDLAASAAGDGSGIAMTANLPLVTRSLGLRGSYYSSREALAVPRLGAEGKAGHFRLNGARMALAWEPRPGWRVLATGLVQTAASDDALYAERGLGSLARLAPMAQPYETRLRMGSAALAIPVGDLDLAASFSGSQRLLRERYNLSRTDPGAGAIELLGGDRLAGGEMRLSRRGATPFLAGIAYSRTATRRQRRRPDRPATDALLLRNVREEFAWFGEANVQVDRNLSLVPGGRLTLWRSTGTLAQGSDYRPRQLVVTEDKGQRAERVGVGFLPSLAISYRPFSTTDLYARFHQAIRPPTYAQFGDAAAWQRGDRLSTLEGGLRRHAASLNWEAAAGYTLWRDVQSDLANPMRIDELLPLGDGRIWFLKVRASVARGPLRVTAAAWFNRSRLVPANAQTSAGELATTPAPVASIPLQTRGARIPNVADWNGQLNIAYEPASAPGGHWRADLALRYAGPSVAGTGARFAALQGGHIEDMIRVGFGTPLWRVGFEIENLLNRRGYRFALGNPYLDEIGLQFVPQRSRSLALSLTRRF